MWAVLSTSNQFDIVTVDSRYMDNCMDYKNWYRWWQNLVVISTVDSKHGHIALSELETWITLYFLVILHLHRITDITAPYINSPGNWFSNPMCSSPGEICKIVRSLSFILISSSWCPTLLFTMSGHSNVKFKFEFNKYILTSGIWL